MLFGRCDDCGALVCCLYEQTLCMACLSVWVTCSTCDQEVAEAAHEVP